MENQTHGGSPSRSASCSASSDLIENLAEWGEYFREKQHGATLTILRAKKTILDQQKEIQRLHEAASYMRDAMRHKPEMWNYAIDYYDAISQQNAEL